jgi:diguanylate cyclase (GGDEF)-like protein
LGSGDVRGEGSAAGRLALEVAAMQASLLGKLRGEVGADGGPGFAEAAQRLAAEFGPVTAAAVEATAAPRNVSDVVGEGRAAGVPVGYEPPAADKHGVPTSVDPKSDPVEERYELPSLYRPGHMRRRLDQLVETNRRYGHPFGLAVFDASGPGVRNGDVGGGQETVLAIVGAALRDSIRIVDEAFRLEEDAICVLAPNLRTVEGMQMAERLLGLLEELERAGGLRIAIAAGVVACPEHGADADELLRKADAAMWRARAVGQPIGVGALQDR